MKIDREYARAVLVALGNIARGTNIRSPAALGKANPRAMLSYSLEARFLHQAMFARRGLRELHVTDAIAYPEGGGPPAIRIHVTAQEPAWFGGVTTAAAHFCFTGTREAQKIRLLQGDSATFDYSAFESKIDLFFIDGAHSYEYVRSDTGKAFRCVRPGEVIPWHDAGRTGVNGVTRWRREFSKKVSTYASFPARRCPVPE